MFPAANSQQRLSVAGAQKTSKKVPLPPGHSLVDWIRLTKSGVDLKGTGPRLLRITEDELAKHNSVDDLWLALRGMVYNVTHYIKYHPGGGEELMRGAGKDATSLFDEVHRWVNYESMLKECLIGKLITTSTLEKKTAGSSMLSLPKPDVSNLDPIGMNMLKPGPEQNTNYNTPLITVNDYAPETSTKLSVSPGQRHVKPNHDWYQDDQSVYVVLYCKTSELKKEQIICDVEENVVFLDVKLNSKLHSYKIELFGSVTPMANLTLTKFGKVQLCFRKTTVGKRWQTLGVVKHEVSDYFVQNFSKVRFCQCTILKKVPLTHDTSSYEIELPESRWFSVPIGSHVYVKVMVEGIDISRPYTPVLPSLVDSHCMRNAHPTVYLAIKHYDNGAVTSTLKPLLPGDKVLISTYDGDFDFSRYQNAKSCVMLAAGTGITPMIKVMHSLLHGCSDCSVHLVFFNKSQQDIVWKNEFDALKELFPMKFFVTHILSQPEKSWNGESGRISHDVMERYVEKYSFKSKDTALMICGPKEFSKLGLDIVSHMGFFNIHVFT